MRQIQVSGPGGDEAEDDAEDEQHASGRGEAGLHRERAPDRPDVTRARDRSRQDSLTDEDGDGAEHRGDVQEQPKGYLDSLENRLFLIKGVIAERLT